MRIKSIFFILWVSMLLFLLACGEKEYVIEFIANGGSEIENQIVKNGETLVLPVITKEGYTFDNWFLDVDFEQSFIENTEITSDLKLYAKWTVNTYTITFETNSEIDKESVVVAYDQPLQIDDLIGDEFNQFQGWFLDGEFNEPFNSEERPASDITLYAKWIFDYTAAYDMITQFDIIEINFDGFSKDVQFIFNRDSIYAKAIDHLEGYEIELFVSGSDEQTLVYSKEISEVYWTLDVEDIPYENSIYYVGLNDMLALIPSDVDMGNYMYEEGTYDLVSAYIEQIESQLSSVLDDTDLFYLPFINLISHELKVVQDKFELTYNVLQDSEPIVFTFGNINQVNFPELDLQVNTEDYVQGVTENQILVGTSIPTTGVMAMLGVPFLAGMQAYFNHINDLGGIAGRQIELISYDNQYDGTVGYDQVETLINVDQVFGLVGLMGGNIITATNDLIGEVSIPSIYPFSSSIGESESIFPVQPTLLFDGINIGYHSVTQPIYGPNGNQALATTESVGVLYGTDPNSLEMYLGVTSVLSQYGYTVEVASIDNNQNTIPYQVASLANKGVSALIVVSSHPLFLSVVQQVEAQSFNVPIFTSNANAIPLDLDIRSSIQVYANAWIDFSSDEAVLDHNDYINIMVEQDFYEYMYNPFSISGYIAAYIFVEGLRRVGDQELTWKTYCEAMEEADIKIPMGGYLNYSDGIRLGSSMYLIKYNASKNIFEPLDYMIE